jgi:hypothetical protein
VPIPAGDASLTPWAPTLDQVASYIPERTLATTVPGVEEALNTFTADTTPTDAQANDFISVAIRYVQMKVGATIDPTLYTDAAAAAAMRAAGLIELAYPTRDGDLNVGDRWLKLADDAIADLRTVNSDPTASTPDALVPVYSFPAAPTYADIPL